MTLTLLNELGVEHSWKEDTIIINPKPIIKETTIVVESDWSSASYYYSLVSLSPNSEVKLSSYKKNSLQGDSVLADIYSNLGVETTFQKNSITLKNTGNIFPSKLIGLNLKGAPDIAQTIVVTCFGLGIECYLTGLHTLKIKETDRLVALKNEIEKLGGEVEITNETLQLKSTNKIIEDINIETYDDHRMAMAFAPIATRVNVIIEESNVVSKSYPTFWEDFNKVTL